MEYKGFNETKSMLQAMTAYLYSVGLKGEFNYTRYPVQLRIEPDEDQQLNIFTQKITKEHDKLPTVTFTLGINDISFKFDGKLDIAEAVFNRIKSYAKKLHYTWLQEYFAALVAGGQRISTIEEYDEYFANIIPSE